MTVKLIFTFVGFVLPESLGAKKCVVVPII